MICYCNLAKRKCKVPRVFTPLLLPQSLRLSFFNIVSVMSNR